MATKAKQSRVLANPNHRQRDVAAISRCRIRRRSCRIRAKTSSPPTSRPPEDGGVAQHPIHDSDVEDLGPEDFEDVTEGPKTGIETEPLNVAFACPPCQDRRMARRAAPASSPSRAAAVLRSACWPSTR